MNYIEQMMAQANLHRERAAITDDPSSKEWLLSRAAYFEKCAKDEELTQENHGKD